jgi:hypothetical protein
MAAMPSSATQIEDASTRHAVSTLANRKGVDTGSTRISIEPVPAELLAEDGESAGASRRVRPMSHG